MPILYTLSSFDTMPECHGDTNRKIKEEDEIEIALSVSSVAFMPDCRILHQKFMHFRDRGCVRTLRPLFAYATDADGTVRYDTMRLLNVR